MDNNFRCSISELVINAAFNWSNVILELGALTAETPGAGPDPNFSIINPMTPNRLSRFVIVASMHWSQELHVFVSIYIQAAFSTRGGRSQLPARNQKETDIPVVVDQLYYQSARVPCSSFVRSTIPEDPL